MARGLTPFGSDAGGATLWQRPRMPSGRPDRVEIETCRHSDGGRIQYTARALNQSLRRTDRIAKTNLERVMMQRIVILFFVAISSVLPIRAEDSWPKVIDFEQGTLTIYQPQADSYENDVLEGRAAVSWTESAGGAPIFGAVWLTMRVEVNRDERMVYVRRLEVPEVRFPNVSEEYQQKLASYLVEELPRWDLP